MWLNRIERRREICKKRPRVTSRSICVLDEQVNEHQHCVLCGSVGLICKLERVHAFTDWMNEETQHNPFLHISLWLQWLLCMTVAWNWLITLHILLIWHHLIEKKLVWEAVLDRWWGHISISQGGLENCYFLKIAQNSDSFRQINKPNSKEIFFLTIYQNFTLAVGFKSRFYIVKKKKKGWKALPIISCGLCEKRRIDLVFIYWFSLSKFTL